MNQKNIIIVLAVLAGFGLLFVLTQQYWGTMGEDVDENMNISDMGVTDEIDIQEPAPSEDYIEFDINELNVPEAVAAARAQVVTDLGLDEEDVTILGFAVHQDWANECLIQGGLDEACASNLEPGYEVELLVQGNERVFRSNADGSIVREEK